FGGGGGGGFGFGGLHLGIGGTLVLIVLSLFFRTNLFQYFLGSPVAVSSNRAPSESNREMDEREKPEVQFVSFVIDDVQKNWDRMLPAQTSVPYRHAKLVLFRNETRSGCGEAETETGPFYCPSDQKVYLDLGFFQELASRFGAPGQFAQAYVIAHEIGHHVQKLTGLEAKFRQAQEENPRQANQISVQLELQADCLAGVWGNSTEQRKIVDQADVKAGLAAAASVGDDRLQKAAQGYVSPEKFTHGTSAQRVAAFQKGLESGQVSACGVTR
ncbi:MAG TPA: neutral zinc metallopeptidase, partial [Bryobacteraceae bacterium]